MKICIAELANVRGLSFKKYNIGSEKEKVGHIDLHPTSVRSICRGIAVCSVSVIRRKVNMIWTWRQLLRWVPFTQQRICILTASAIIKEESF